MAKPRPAEVQQLMQTGSHRTAPCLAWNCVYQAGFELTYLCLPGVAIKGASYHQTCLLRFALFMYVHMNVCFYVCL